MRDAYWVLKVSTEEAPTEIRKAVRVVFSTDRQSVVVLFSSPRCRDESGTQLAHYFVRGYGFAVELGCSLHFREARLNEAAGAADAAALVGSGGS